MCHDITMQYSEYIFNNCIFNYSVHLLNKFSILCNMGQPQPENFHLLASHYHPNAAVTCHLIWLCSRSGEELDLVVWVPCVSEMLRLCVRRCSPTPGPRGEIVSLAVHCSSRASSPLMHGHCHKSHTPLFRHSPAWPAPPHYHSHKINGRSPI